MGKLEVELENEENEQRHLLYREAESVLNSSEKWIESHHTIRTDNWPQYKQRRKPWVLAAWYQKVAVTLKLGYWTNKVHH